MSYDAPHARPRAPVLDILCPMHIEIEKSGHIRHVGPTLRKLRPEIELSERRFLEVFEVLRPRQVTTIAKLRTLENVKLHLRFRDAPQTGMQGILITATGNDTMLLNLSFGINVMDAVKDYDLTSTDFAATDLAIEMLFLVEAKSAAMAASRKLNRRLEAAMIAAEEQAFTDTLTGLKNRRAIEHILPRLMESGQGFALMQMDLDFFKSVNDTHGHAAGDYVLQEVAKVLVEETRDHDDVARIGGDEFVLIFQNGITRTKLGKIAKRIIERIQEPIVFKGADCTVSASIGITAWNPSLKIEIPVILSNADIALYSCKERGRGCFTFFEDLLSDDFMKPIDDLPKDLKQLAENGIP